MFTMTSTFFILFATIWSIQSESISNPHIVYILIDDLGYANVQFHNHRQLTPNLDKIVQHSLYLNNFYTFKYCSPSRSSLMTGRLPYHVNQRNGPMCTENFGIPRNMTTISEILVNEAGYIAHQIGKWDVGMASMAHTPYGKLFTSSIGYFHADEDHYTQTFDQEPIHNVTCSGIDLWNTTKPAYKQNGTYGGYIYGQRAIQVINNYNINHNKPLFLYLATQNNHKPFQVPQSYIDKFPSNWYSVQRIYAAMSNFEDELIGNVTKALKAKNLWNNTLLIITSDNGGPPGAGNNSPLRGGKKSNFEGGVRVVAMIGGGYLPQHRRGKTLNGTIHIADIYATLCSIVGIDPTDHRAAKANLPAMDSINMWPFILGETNDVSPRNEVLLSTYVQNGGGALIKGDYKILFGDQSPAFWTTLDFPNGTQGEPQSIYCGNVTNGGCLFDLFHDPTEHNDIINKSENAQIVQEMRERYMTLSDTVYAPYLGNPDPRCCQQIQINSGYWGPWLSDD